MIGSIGISRVQALWLTLKKKPLGAVSARSSS
jgi:hypothetical protein